MSTETNAAVIGLSEDTLAKLRELRRLNVDSAKGFEECVELVDDQGVKQAFGEIARERWEQAQALATQIEWNDEAEPEDGSYLAALHRAWIKVREACSSNDVEAVVAEAKRGDESLCNAYADAEEACKGSPVYKLVTEQHQTIKSTCSRLNGLCDAKAC